MKQSSEADQVERTLRGDREAYAALVRKYQAFLYRHALGMVADSDAAADLVQDSLVKAYVCLGSCRNPEHFGAWVFRILRNCCHDYLRDRRRQVLSLDESLVEPEAREGPEYDLERMTLGRALDSALARLPEAQREAFLLKHVEGCSYEEMTGLLDASVSALKMRVLRARESLQSLLADRRDPDL